MLDTEPLALHDIWNTLEIGCTHITNLQTHGDSRKHEGNILNSTNTENGKKQS
jgi:hypothetical protein